MRTPSDQRPSRLPCIACCRALEPRLDFLPPPFLARQTSPTSPGPRRDEQGRRRPMEPSLPGAPLLPHAPSLDPAALHLRCNVAGPAALSHRPCSSAAATEGAAAAVCISRASPASPSRFSVAGTPPACRNSTPRHPEPSWSVAAVVVVCAAPLFFCSGRPPAR
uniref:Uncharacterized protein n=1 Tax=Triticum urartu TaxID=4572 RepID=A0A8R7P3V0_TRIUA